MREPDHTIGRPPLVKRWILFRSKRFTVNLHQILRDDDAPELHRHPWWNVSIILRGAYLEHTENRHLLRYHGPGSVIFRRAATRHKLELCHGPVWTLFIHGKQNAHLRSPS